jgi:hypothetical protein
MASVAVRIANPRARTINQKNEAFKVKALRAHPYFEQIVKRIVAGDGNQQIARWCEASAKSAGIKNFSFLTWKESIKILRRRVTRLMEVNEVSTTEPTPELVAQTMEQISRDNNIPSEQIDGPELKIRMTRIWTAIRKAINVVDSERILKAAFLVQADRVEKLMEMEENQGTLIEFGFREILVLKDIGAELRKFEVGEQMLRGGKSHAYGGEFDRKPPDLHSATTSAPVDRTVAPDNSLLGRVSRLDEVDRNLLIAASTRVIDMIELETQIAKPETGGVEANTGSEAPAGNAVDSGPAQQDDAGSAPDIRDGNPAGPAIQPE